MLNSAVARLAIEREAMLEGASGADGEAEAHGGCDDKVGEDLDGMLDSEDHGGTLTQYEEDDRPGALRGGGNPAAPIAFTIMQASLNCG